MGKEKQTEEISSVISIVKSFQAPKLNKVPEAREQQGAKSLRLRKYLGTFCTYILYRLVGIVDNLPAATVYRRRSNSVSGAYQGALVDARGLVLAWSAPEQRSATGSVP